MAETDLASLMRLFGGSNPWGIQDPQQLKTLQAMAMLSLPGQSGAEAFQMPPLDPNVGLRPLATLGNPAQPAPMEAPPVNAPAHDTTLPPMGAIDGGTPGKPAPSTPWTRPPNDPGVPDAGWSWSPSAPLDFGDGTNVPWYIPPSTPTGAAPLGDPTQAAPKPAPTPPGSPDVAPGFLTNLRKQAFGY